MISIIETARRFAPRNDRLIFLSFLLLSSGHYAFAKPHAPLPPEAYDGGVISAETLGRGGTIASNHPTLASGSENPAALETNTADAAYATALVHTSSVLPDDTAQSTDPLTGKALQYLAFGSDRGVIFFEPLARRQERQIIDAASPSTDYQDVKLSANAIGFAGAAKWKQGSVGLSIAYLTSSLATTEHRSGQPDTNALDTSDGLRLNIGLRFPTGPAMWGLLIQNAPGILWGNEYQRELLPFRIRLGNTWRLAPGFLLSFDAEKRFYQEGSDKRNLLNVGSEWFLSKNFVIRAGMFGEDLNKSEDRHTTAGFTIIAKTGTNISYAFEHFELNNEAVKRSLVSVQLPFEATVEEAPPR